MKYSSTWYCFSYGGRYAQTGADYAYKQGVQMTALREMVRAVAGV